jgi:hypothetical protein
MTTDNISELQELFECCCIITSQRKEKNTRLAGGIFHP